MNNQIEKNLNRLMLPLELKNSLNLQQEAYPNLDINYIKISEDRYQLIIENMPMRFFWSLKLVADMATLKGIDFNSEMMKAFHFIISVYKSMNH